MQECGDAPLRARTRLGGAHAHGPPGPSAMSPLAAREAVICEPLRTPVGRFGGVFRDVPATVLAATVIGELVRRTSVRGEDVDDVILGQCYRTERLLRSAGWPRSTQDWGWRFRVCRSIAAAARRCRP